MMNIRIAVCVNVQNHVECKIIANFYKYCAANVESTSEVGRGR